MTTGSRHCSFSMSIALSRKYRAGLLAGGLLAAPFVLAAPAQASEAEEQLAKIEAQLNAQGLCVSLSKSESWLEQWALIESQGLEIRALREQREQILSDIRAGRPRRQSPEVQRRCNWPHGRHPRPPAANCPPSRWARLRHLPARRLEQDVAAIPPDMGVLTPNGTLIIDSTPRIHAVERQSAGVPGRRDRARRAVGGHRRQ